MDPADIVVLAIIALSAIYALFRGAVREVLSIVSWVLAIYAALLLRPAAQDLVAEYVQEAWLASVIAVLGVFLVALILFGLIVRRVSKRIKESNAGVLDRSIGVIFGIARGLLVVGLLYVPFYLIYGSEDQPAFVEEARTLPVMRASAAILVSLLPESARETAAETLSEGLDAADSASGLMDAADRMENLMSGEEAENADPDEDSGYNPDQRSQMDRLIENVSEPE